jgi:hypothetical protein
MRHVVCTKKAQAPLVRYAWFQLLCLGVEQDDRCPLNFERIAHLTIKGQEVARLQIR